MKKRRWFILITIALAMCACMCLCCACKDPVEEPGPGLENEEPEVELERLVVSKQPDKMVYNKGERFDPTGMELTAYYADGSESIITEGYTYEKTTPLYAKDDIITVRWGGQVARISVTVTIKLQTKLTVSTDDSAVYTIEAEDLRYNYCTSVPYVETPSADKNTSGGQSITGLGTAGNVFGFAIESEVDAEIVLVMRASAAHSNIDVDSTVSIVYNDQKLVSDQALDWSEGGWFNWENICYDQSLNLQEGLNNVLLTIQSRPAPNIDCFYILVNPTEDMLRDFS